MKQLFFILILAIGLTMSAQSFYEPLPDNFTAIELKLDLFGSLDKEGINSVLAFTVVDHKVIEYELQIQTIFTNKYTKSILLYYTDVQFGAGYMFALSDRVTFTTGIHGGYLFKQNFYPDGTKLEGYFIYGLTAKGRWWMGKRKKWGFVIGGSYDARRDNNNWEINGNGGITRRF